MQLAMLNETQLFMKRTLTLALVLILSTSCLAQQHPGAEEFAAKAASESGLDQAEVLQLLQNARFKQSIVDAMTRPAEAKPWHKYRPIFITDKRINGGVAFWRENEALISKAAEEFGVDPQIIVAIIGVETLYGRITGNYRRKSRGPMPARWGWVNSCPAATGNTQWTLMVTDGVICGVPWMMLSEVWPITCTAMAGNTVSRSPSRPRSGMTPIWTWLPGAISR